jgi:hypothetical protein
MSSLSELEIWEYVHIKSTITIEMDEQQSGKL